MGWVPIDEDAVYAMTVFDHAPPRLQAQVRLEGEEPLQAWWGRLDWDRQNTILAEGRMRLVKLQMDLLRVTFNGRNY